MKHLFLSIFAVGMMFSPSLQATSNNTLYVDVSGSGTICSYNYLCPSILTAVDMAAAGDTIRIAEGDYVENVDIPAGKDGLRLIGQDDDDTRVISAGGISGEEAPPNIPVDILIDIFSKDVTIERMTLEHPEGMVVKRDTGIFVRPSASNATVRNCNPVRNRIGELNMGPGSRGVFVIRAPGSGISLNKFRETMKTRSISLRLKPQLLAMILWGRRAWVLSSSRRQ